MPLLEFGPVDADEMLLRVEQEFRERLAQFGLADTGRPEEQERTVRAIGIGEPGARTANRVRHETHRLVDKVDRLVRQKTIGDVTVRQFRRGHEVHVRARRPTAGERVRGWLRSAGAADIDPVASKKRQLTRTPEPPILRLACLKYLSVECEGSASRLSVLPARTEGESSDLGLLRNSWC